MRRLNYFNLTGMVMVIYGNYLLSVTTVSGLFAITPCMILLEKITIKTSQIVTLFSSGKIRPQYVQQKDTKDTVRRYIVLLLVEKADSCKHDSK